MQTFNYDFVEPDFMEAFMLWVNHKRAMKKGYKTQQSLQICYKHLKHISGTPQNALQIIETSIANNWAGLFPLKNNHGNTTANRQQSGFDIARQSLADTLTEIAKGRIGNYCP